MKILENACFSKPIFIPLELHSERVKVIDLGLYRKTFHWGSIHPDVSKEDKASVKLKEKNSEKIINFFRLIKLVFTVSHKVPS